MAGAKDIPDTNIVLPRNYGVVIESGSNMFFYDPARYAVAYALLMTQAELLSALSTWQDYKKKETEELHNGTLSYLPRFSAQGLEQIMNCSLEEAEEEIMAGIKKTEGSMNLWVVGGKGASGAVKNAKLYGARGRETIEGDVKSKSEGYNNVHISNVFLTDEGYIQHRNIYSSAPDSDWESGAKHLMSMGCHAAALETAQYLQLTGRRDFGIDYGKRKLRRTDPALTFNFVSQEYLKRLVMDVLVARYMNKETLYQINRKLMEGEIRDAIFSPGLDNTARTGRARYAVMRQQTKEVGRSKSYQEAENAWTRKIGDKLKERGYSRQPFYTLAFTGSPWEMVAERWENGSRAVEIACSFDYAPLVLVKDLQGDVRFHSSLQPSQINPFLRMGAEERTFDGCSARECMQKILGPEEMAPLEMSDKMQGVYRRMIREAEREQRKKEKEFRQPMLPMF